MTPREYEFWHISITLGMTLMFCIVFMVIHSHVWTKEGYSGTNKQLELHEVDKFIAHVISEASFVALFLISMLEPLVVSHLKFSYTWETKIIFGATFLSAGAYVFFGKSFKKWIRTHTPGSTDKSE